MAEMRSWLDARCVNPAIPWLKDSLTTIPVLQCQDKLPFPLDPPPSTLLDRHPRRQARLLRGAVCADWDRGQGATEWNTALVEIFENGDEALKEAEDERTELLAKGWLMS
jgi:hypothetical protein